MEQVSLTVMTSNQGQQCGQGRQGTCGGGRFALLAALDEKSGVFFRAGEPEAGGKYIDRYVLVVGGVDQLMDCGDGGEGPDLGGSVCTG